MIKLRWHEHNKGHWKIVTDPCATLLDLKHTIVAMPNVYEASVLGDTRRIDAITLDEAKNQAERYLKDKIRLLLHSLYQGTIENSKV